MAPNHGQIIQNAKLNKEENDQESIQPDAKRIKTSDDQNIASFSARLEAEYLEFTKQIGAYDSKISKNEEPVRVESTEENAASNQDDSEFDPSDSDVNEIEGYDLEPDGKFYPRYKYNLADEDEDHDYSIELKDYMVEEESTTGDEYETEEEEESGDEANDEEIEKENLKWSQARERVNRRLKAKFENF